MIGCEKIPKGPKTSHAKAQREQSSLSWRTFAPWRLCARLFIFSHLLWRERPAPAIRAMAILAMTGHGQDARATARRTGKMPVYGSGHGQDARATAHGRDARATAGETPMNRGRLPALPPPSPRRRPHRASWQAVSGRRLSTCSGDTQNGSAICGCCAAAGTSPRLPSRP